MKSRSALRGTPAFWASTVISARHWVITPSSRLWQILTMRASSPSPTYVTPAPSLSRKGSAILYASAGPDTTSVSLPVSTTLALPLTGAASIWVPRLAAAARILADASSETLEVSTSSFGVWWPVSRPRGPVITLIRSSEVETLVNTMSQPASAAAESTIDAPSAASGSALARVRL